MNWLKGRSVLVTGAGGFIASHLIPKLLDSGAKVTGLDLPGVLEASPHGYIAKIDMIKADMTRFAELEKHDGKYDYVVHLAAIAAPAQCDQNPSKAFDVNVNGTFSIMKYARKSAAKKVVFVSSAHVYGISPKYMPTDESHPLALHDVYTTTKILGESLCQLFYSNHGLAYTTVRLFNSYGPGQSTDYFIPAMMTKATTGLIRLKGAKVTKDFVYVDDVVEALTRALESEFVGELNVGSGAQTTLESVAGYIAKKFGAKLEFDDAETSGPTHMQADMRRANSVLSWHSTTSMEAGLDRTIDSFRRQRKE